MLLQRCEGTILKWIICCVCIILYVQRSLIGNYHYFPQTRCWIIVACLFRYNWGPKEQLICIKSNFFTVCTEEIRSGSLTHNSYSDFIPCISLLNTTAFQLHIWTVTISHLYVNYWDVAPLQLTSYWRTECTLFSDRHNILLKWMFLWCCEAECFGW